MLVIISDLHLTDGTSGETIRPHDFRVFRENLRDMAYEASWRSDGTYRPIESLDLVLLGDILDLIRSVKWLDSPDHVRPWSDSQSAPFINMIQTISDAILRQNAESLSIIKSLSAGNAITLPPATAESKPAKVGYEPEAQGRLPVQVKVHYMVGNHDWFYHLPGDKYNGIRQSVIDVMGLANPADAPFPHDPYESDIIPEIYEKHRLFARHGDIYDPFNYEQERDASSLGDVIVVELLNRFPSEVEKRLGRLLPKECTDGLKEVDNVRPLLVIPVWVDGLLRRTCPDAKVIKQVKQVWDELVDQFLKIDFVQKRDSAFTPFDNVDKLELALKFPKGVSLSKLSDVLTWVREKMSGSQNSFYRNALKEKDFKNRKAQFIVYGHTHHPEIVPLDSAFMSTGILNQMYLNSGTWRRVHELAQMHPDEQEFMGYYVMTYLSFFTGDERKGRAFESWSGALG